MVVIEEILDTNEEFNVDIDSTDGIDNTDGIDSTDDIGEIVNIGIKENKSSLQNGGSSDDVDDGNDGDDGDNGDDDGDDGNDNTSLEVISEIPNKSSIDPNDKTISPNLLQGGVSIIYNIDFIVADDEKLINIEKVNKQVDKYIENYNSIEMTKYKQSFKQIYQKYSNKKYTITLTSIKQLNTIGSKIIVTRNDKNNSKVIELNKPLYFFYNKDSNLTHLKRQISNNRTELLYKYEKLTSKLIITPEAKKDFENERLAFIELLEKYYTYTLYHKKINNIITINTTNLIIQEPLQLYKENSDEYSTVISGNIYSIDKSTIDIMNNLNSQKLTEYNNLIVNISGKDTKDISKNKKIIEEIKSYINHNEIKAIIDSNRKKFDKQDKYIDYIILNLPSSS